MSIVTATLGSRHWPAIVLLLVLVILVYLPGLPGDFMFDDYPNIVNNTSLHLEHLDGDGLLTAAFAGNAGPLKRPLAMLSFGLNYWLDGLHPLGYKLINLGLHAVNALLVYVLVLLLLRAWPQAPVGLDERARRRIGLLAALFWALHPLNLSTVLLVVQRMTGMASLFMLLGLLAFCTMRIKMLDCQAGVWRYLGATLAALILASLSKETGVLLLAYILVCELCVFRFRTVTPVQSRILTGGYILSVGVPALLAIYFSVIDTTWLQGLYELHPYTLAERLLTESRVLWFYLWMLFLPSLETLGIFHDDIVLSTGLFSPPVTALAVGALGLLLAVGLWAWRRGWVLGFAILWFLAGHSLESTVLPLELAHEHRNYLPAIGPLFALAYYLQHPALSVRLKRVLPGLAVVMLVLFSALTALRAWEWHDPLNMALMEVRHHPRSQRVQYQLGRMYLLLYKLEHRRDFLDRSHEHLEQAAALDPFSQLALFGLINVDSIRSGQAQPGVLDRLGRRLREQPFHVSTVTAFQSLVGCISEAYCHISRQQVLDLFNRALENPTLRGQDRTNVQVQLASYYLTVAGDGDSAVRVLRDVIRQQPRVWAYRTSLIRVYLAAHAWRRAAAELARARQLLAVDGGFLQRGPRMRQLREFQATLSQAGVPSP